MTKATHTAVLHDFRPLSVGKPLAQADNVAWLQRALRRARRGRLGAQDRRALALYSRLARGSAIAERVSAVPDYARTGWREMELFKTRGGAPWYRPPLQERMRLYEKTVLALARRAFPRGEPAPDYALQVSCTGYASPHALQRVASARGWGARLLHLGHMGCYAGIPAAGAAAGLVAGRGARASVFLAELCTLHLKPDANADEQVVVNALFADGAIRFDVSARAEGPALELIATGEELVPGSEGDMGWRLESSAFDMSLSRGVPERIGGAVGGFVERFLKRSGRRLEDVGRFAIHPGGPRVIEGVLRALGLSEDAAPHSRELLRRRGNMSSCTLPHVWAALLADPAVRDGELILSLAFGPGLTMAAALMRKRA